MAEAPGMRNFSSSSATIPASPNWRIVLAGHGNKAELARMRGNFPAPALAVIDFDVDIWQKARRGDGPTRTFRHTPRARQMNRIGKVEGSPVPSFADFLFDTGLAIQNLAESLSGRPLRLGVTGLSGAGKTIFVTALVQHLTLAARVAALGGKNPLPVFRVHAEGRLVRGAIQPQPDDAVPRFAYEDHIATLTGRAAMPTNARGPNRRAASPNCG